MMRAWVHVPGEDEGEDVCALWIKLRDDLFVYVLANGTHGLSPGRWEKRLDDDSENWVRL